MIGFARVCNGEAEGSTQGVSRFGALTGAVAKMCVAAVLSVALLVGFSLPVASPTQSGEEERGAQVAQIPQVAKGSYVARGSQILRSSQAVAIMQSSYDSQSAQFPQPLQPAMLSLLASLLQPNKAFAATSSASKKTAKVRKMPGVSKYGWLKVKGSRIVSSKGKTAQLKGLSTHGLGWYPEYVNNACFKQLRNNFGINVIRLALYTQEYNGYCSGGSKKKLTKLVERGVKYAKAHNMYAIIDWHILSDGNPKTHQRAARTFFRKMAKKYAKCPNVIFEICNEPNGSTSWKTIRSYAKKVIPVIRKYSKKSLIIVGTPTWSQRVDSAADNPLPKKYGNVAYALHFYAGTHKADLRNTMNRAIAKGLPVFVSEFGICDASGSGGVNKTEAARWIEALDARHVSYVMWSLSNKNETSAILKPGCKKTSGFTTGNLTASGRWFCNMMGGKLPKVSASGTGAADLSLSGASGSNGSGSGSGTNGSGSGANGVSFSSAWKTAKSGGMTVSYRIVNAWKSGVKTCCQYDFKVKNASGARCSSWKVSVELPKSAKVAQCWCAKATASGKKLTISNESWNGAIDAGASATGIGAIVQTS